MAGRVPDEPEVARDLLAELADNDSLRLTCAFD